jgi:hypothetical protein
VPRLYDPAGVEYSGAMRRRVRRAGCLIAAVLACAALFGRAAGASTDLAALRQSLRWGMSGADLLKQFAAAATPLPQSIDFGDSYAPIVLRDVTVGGVTLIAFFQFDKTSGGLKRVQLERQRHGVNPPAFRGVVGGLEGAFGIPDAACAIAPGPWSGYQAASEIDWWRGGDLIRAVFRDTTIEAVEGCLDRDLALGPCGLTGQLFVRISPPAADRVACPPPGRAQ